MKILAVDSVGKTIDVMVINDDKIIKKQMEMSKNASEFLLPLIDDTLTECNININDLDYLALNVGPGSFTGIRIAMSLFKGIMVSTNLKCIVVNSFELLSYNITDEKYIVNLDSGTSGYYSMIKDSVVTAYLALDTDSLKKMSSEYKIYSDTPLNGVEHTVTKKKDNFYEVVMDALKRGNVKNEYELEPLYVKKAQSEREYKQKYLSTVKIENATTNDVDDILSLENNNFAHPYTKEQIMFDIEKNNVLVAIDNGKIIGYIDYLVSDQTEILKICVEKSKRNMGVGEKLIEKLNFFEKDVLLEVSENNPAKNFYAKIGFKYLYSRKKYYKDGSDAIIMIKPF